MKSIFKRLVAWMSVFAILSFGPVNAAENPSNEADISDESMTSSCYAPEGVYCNLSIDMNTVHRYTDFIIPLSFEICGMEKTDIVTLNISSTLNISHNISNSDLYSVVDNQVELIVNILDEPTNQSLNSLVFEKITIEILNERSEVVYTLDVPLLNTQYGLFVGFINNECLFDYYGQWLLDNGYISKSNYDIIIEEKMTAKPIGDTRSAAQTYATATYTPASTYVSCTITPYNSGADLDIQIYVGWVDTAGSLHPARYVSVDVLDVDAAENQVLATGSTSKTGFFYADVENQTDSTENGGVDIRIRVKATTPYASITNYSGTVHSFIVNCGDNVGANTIYGNYGFGDAFNNVSRSFYILDAITTGSLYVKAMSGNYLDSIDVVYPYGGPLTSHYNQRIHLLDSDYSSWDTTLHEYGHYVSDSYNIYPFVAVAHDITDNAITYICENGLWDVGSTLLSSIKYDGCALAWQEGWACYFSIVAQIQQGTASLGISGVGDVSYGALSLELNNSSGKGEAHELAVARVLWDMTDGGTMTGSTDTDPILWGYYNVWKYTTESGAETFSQFMSSIYSRYSNSPTIYRNLGYLLQYHRVSATLSSATFNSSCATVNWSPAFEDTYVGNDYYLDVYNSDMVRVYTKQITSTPCVIDGTVWTNLCTNYGDGLYICIRTCPYDAAIGYTDTYGTGPYYSRFVSCIPDEL